MHPNPVAAGEQEDFRLSFANIKSALVTCLLGRLLLPGGLDALKIRVTETRRWWAGPELRALGASRVLTKLARQA
jgi:hypothetical protein